MNQKLKKLTKLGILLFGISIILTNCQKDDELKTNQALTKNDSPFKMEIISKEDMNKNSEVSKAFNKFNSLNKNLQNKTVYNDDYEFTVNTDFVKYIESNDGSVHSYTFKIDRDEDNGYLENLVLTLQPDGTYDNKFVRYNYIDDNTLEISYADLDIDEDDYLSKLTIVETCVTTVTGTCHVLMDNGDCDFWQFTSSTSCSYSIYDTGGGGGGSGSGSGTGSTGTGGPNWGGTVWTNQGGSNGGSGNSGGSNTVVTSPTAPQPWEEVALCLSEISMSGSPNDFTPEMSAWLQNQPKSVVGQINNILQEDNCSEEAQEFAIDFINANLNSPFEVDLFEFAPEDSIVLPDNKKFLCIYNTLANSPSFKNLFIDTFNESTDMHITFALSDNFSDSQAAVTSPDSLNSVSHQTITLNANHLNTKHPLSIAQTIIHEALHAFLNYKQSDGICNPNNDGPSIYELESLTLGELLNDFNYNCIENATNDHNLMFNLLIPVMEQQLNEVFNDLVAPEDLSPIYYFYPPPNGDQHSFTWGNAIYYMCLEGLEAANSYTSTTTEIPNSITSESLKEEYHLQVNNPNYFNHSTCEE